MKLLHDLVAIERDLPPEASAGGILLQEQIKTTPPFGIVKYIGPAVKEVNVGDRVCYKVYSSIDVDIDEGLDVLPISGVMAVL